MNPKDRLRWLILSFGATNLACVGGTDDSGSEEAPPQYSLTLDVSIESIDGVATFLTPTVSPQPVTTSDIVDKPWYMAFFEAGSEAGIDYPVIEQWGEVSEDMEISFTTPAQFETGPHDAVFVIYVNPMVIDEDVADFAPAAVTGDLASFTLGEQVVRDGDPPLNLAFLRFNVDDQDAQLSITNKTPGDWDNNDELFDSYVDTILIVP